MSAPTNNGGPAFPGFDYINQHGKKNPEGMTLRDYFAAKAMAAHIASGAALSIAEMYGADKVNQSITGASYAMADAMLKAREADHA